MEKLTVSLVISKSRSLASRNADDDLTDAVSRLVTDLTDAGYVNAM